VGSYCQSMSLPDMMARLISVSNLCKARPIGRYRSHYPHGVSWIFHGLSIRFSPNFNWLSTLSFLGRALMKANNSDAVWSHHDILGEQGLCDAKNDAPSSLAVTALPPCAQMSPQESEDAFLHQLKPEDEIGMIQPWTDVPSIALPHPQPLVSTSKIKLSRHVLHPYHAQARLRHGPKRPSRGALAMGEVGVCDCALT
jgi:hypothetical protein